ncbi:MAG: hypothetical protein E6H47_09220 [Betaproteobacteria bacterium]|nr:MAG: hypothetical protein E6H47_09220 [Betaproteobacteria bacterium]
MIGALAVGAAAAWGLGSFKPSAGALFAIAHANPYVPEFFVERDCRARRAPGDHAARGSEQRK